MNVKTLRKKLEKEIKNNHHRIRNFAGEEVGLYTEFESNCVRLHFDILDWSEEIIGHEDLTNYNKFEWMRDHPDKIQIVMVVEILLHMARCYKIVREGNEWTVMAGSD